MQSRIILSILIGGTIGSSSLKRATKISGSRWRQERLQLVEMGLMGCTERKEFRQDGIRRVKYFFLTKKGVDIAKHVEAMAKLLVEDNPSKANANLASIIV